MINKYKEWLRQAEYDMATADAMFKSGRYIYAVFMCHLSIEKGLKGLYHYELDIVLPKTHNLIYLLNQISKNPEVELKKFIIKLNTASLATRYPDDLAKIQSAYTKTVVKEIIVRSKEVLEWIKMQF